MSDQFGKDRNQDLIDKVYDLMNEGPEEIIEFFEQHFVEQACAIADKQITVPIDRNLFKQALRDKFK